jgi:hypothetical protein
LPVGPVRLDIHTFVAACMAILIGVQAVTFAGVAQRYATARGLLPPGAPHSRLLGALTSERLLKAGAAAFGAGLLGLLWSAWQWAALDFGPIGDRRVLRVVVLAFTGLAAGVQLAFVAFLASLMETPVEPRGREPGDPGGVGAD